MSADQAPYSYGSGYDAIPSYTGRSDAAGLGDSGPSQDLLTANTDTTRVGSEGPGNDDPTSRTYGDMPASPFYPNSRVYGANYPAPSSYETRFGPGYGAGTASRENAWDGSHDPLSSGHNSSAHAPDTIPLRPTLTDSSHPLDPRLAGQPNDLPLDPERYRSNSDMRLHPESLYQSAQPYQSDYPIAEASNSHPSRRLDPRTIDQQLLDPWRTPQESRNDRTYGLSMIGLSNGAPSFPSSGSSQQMGLDGRQTPHADDPANPSAATTGKTFQEWKESYGASPGPRRSAAIACLEGATSVRIGADEKVTAARCPRVSERYLCQGDLWIPVRDSKTGKVISLKFKKHMEDFHPPG